MIALAFRACCGEPWPARNCSWTSTEQTPWAAITGVIATVSVFAIAQGLSYPLLSFILQRQGVSPSLIGLSAAMTPIGFIVSSPLIPALARRFGAGRTALTCAAPVGAGAGADRLDAGSVCLVPASLPDRRHHQPALRAERDLDDRAGAAGPARPHHGRLHVDHFGRLRGRTAVPARRRLAWLAALPGRHLRLRDLRHLPGFRPQAIAEGRRGRAPGFRAGLRAAGLAAAVRGGRRRRVRAGRAGAAAGLRHPLRHRRSPHVGAAFR